MSSIQTQLIYVTDSMHGWRRVRRGRGFSYHAADGSHIRDPEQLERIRRLAIPPAYTNVWICPSADGHLQATGRDARGRKQYRYHPMWQEQRKRENFNRLRDFGKSLPTLRRAVERDLAHDRPDLEAVVATVVKLLDLTAQRIGNDEYSTHNGSYGLSTLRNQHVRTRVDRLMLDFKGKSGVMQQASIQHHRVARIVRQCQELPGQRLFQFIDEQGEVRHVRSEHVNDYLRRITGEDFTAKDFRTWHASACAMGLVLQAQAGQPGLDGAAIVQQVAQRLGNTCAVCRKFYIHPAVLQLCEPAVSAQGPSAAGRQVGLRREECALLALLEQPRQRRLRS